jgi:predicted GH43/DUF377 family glycosyl hydrolase
MFAWRKRGRIFNPADHRNGTWLNEFAQAPSVVVLDDVVRVYFSCRPAPAPDGKYVSYSAYVDLDRKDLFTIREVAKEPILPLGGLGCFDEFGIYPVSVIRNGEEFWAYYTGHTRCESVPFTTAIGLATSRDGRVFSRMGPGPVISYSLDEPFVMSGPKIRKFGDTFYLWYISGKKWIEENGRKEVVYKIRMATSQDGMAWRKENRDIIADKIDEHETQASPDVFFDGGLYHMFFCYKHASGFREDKARSYRIGYASSRDLKNWERNDDLAGIGVSESGWDSDMVAYPHVFALDGKIYMLYLGNEVGKYGFGLAELEGGLTP